MRRCTGRATARGERGSMAIEMVLLAPVLMAFVLLVVMFGRYVAVRGDIDSAARDAARSASMQVSLAAARSQANDVVAASLDSQTSCQRIQVGGDWGPGGTVTVRLTCRVSYDQLGLLGVPGSAEVTAESSAPLDPYRRYQ